MRWPDPLPILQMTPWRRLVFDSGNTFAATINREKFIGVKIQSHVTGEDAYRRIIMDAAFVGASGDLVRRMKCHEHQKIVPIEGFTEVHEEHERLESVAPDTARGSGNPPPRIRRATDSAARPLHDMRRCSCSERSVPCRRSNRPCTWPAACTSTSTSFRTPDTSSPRHREPPRAAD